MAFYPDRNGRAQDWDRDHHRLELSKWVFHNPEELETLVECLADFLIPDREEKDLLDLIDDLLEIIDVSNDDIE